MVILTISMLFYCFHAEFALSAENIIFEEKTQLGNLEGLGWRTWSNREETSPKYSLSDITFDGRGASLAIEGISKPQEHGCWYAVIDSIVPDTYYSIEGYYRTESVPYPRQQVYMRLDWLSEDGSRIDEPDYVPDGETAGEWTKVYKIYQAPKDAKAVKVELYLSHADQGTVWWDNIVLKEAAKPEPRMLRAGVINCFPRNMKTSLESLEQWVPMIRKAGEANVDIVCLGEGLNLCGLDDVVYSDVAEPIPGPTTERLGELAARYGMYIVGALGEKEGECVYNTAFLIDREGKVAGKYRKMQIPHAEIDGGVTPGSDLPVFDTDFGRIGIMICWDSQFPLPARALAARGAEIILLPIWGGTEFVVKTRAYENQVYIVSCAYDGDMASIYNPKGERIAHAKSRNTVAWTDIDLAEPFRYPWVGNFKDKLYRERRADVKIKELER